MRNSFLIYTEYSEQLELLTMEERGVLLTALIAYQSGEQIPDMTPVTRMAFSFIKAQVDRDNARYEEKCEKNRANGSKGGRPKKQEVTEETECNQTVNEETERFLEKPKKPYYDNDHDNDHDIKEKNIKKEKRAAFVPPTAEEVAQYVRENGLSVNADAFVDFYTSKNWLVGKAKMKDWRAACRGWHNRHKDDPKPKPANRFHNFDERKYNFEDLERRLLMAGGAT